MTDFSPDALDELRRNVEVARTDWRDRIASTYRTGRLPDDIATRCLTLYDRLCSADSFAWSAETYEAGRRWRAGESHPSGTWGAAFPGAFDHARRLREDMTAVADLDLVDG